MIQSNIFSEDKKWINIDTENDSIVWVNNMIEENNFPSKE